MNITQRNYYENTKLAVSKEFSSFNEKQVIHAANVICNFLKKQCFDLWEVHVSEGSYKTFDDGYYAYDKVMACGEIIYLTMRID